VRDQVSHPDSTTGKITVLYIWIFRFFIWDGKTKDFGLNNSKHSPSLIYSWFHHECKFNDTSIQICGVWNRITYFTGIMSNMIPKCRDEWYRVITNDVNDSYQ
jgi:hypothetical protein